MPKLTDTSDLKQRILEESKEYVVYPPKNGEFTMKDFMGAHDDIGRETARRVLRQMERDGKIYSRDGITKNNKRCKVYGWK